MGALDENKREKRQIEEKRERSRSSAYFRPEWGISLKFPPKKKWHVITTFLFMQGPNYVGHCDGYDKLKPYGFAIHGCMDGTCVVVGFTSVASFFSVYISSFPAISMFHVPLDHITYRYSHRVLWLAVGVTNDNPPTTAQNASSSCKVSNIV